MFSKVYNLYKRGEYIYKREGLKTLFKKTWNFYRDVIFIFIHRLNLIDKIFLCRIVSPSNIKKLTMLINTPILNPVGI